MELSTDKCHCCGFKLKYLDPLLEAVKQKNESGDMFPGFLDLDRLGFIGHSRGGKISALHFLSENFIHLKVWIPFFSPLFDLHRDQRV